MLNQLKVKIAKLLAQFVPQAVFEQLKAKEALKGDFSQLYYSQEGEEIILRRFFKFKNKGFFVDIGAHHPLRFSNTYQLYKLGWRGINIDATPGSMTEFKHYRKEDINIEAGISDTNETLYFYCFNEPALNTFDEIKAKQIASSEQYNLIKKQEIKTVQLSEILNNYINSDQEIDFFTIDAEGFDLKVLKSNDWNKYKPNVIVVESSFIDITSLSADEIFIYLDNLGYKPFAKTFKSVFYSR
jgi:FkbM family methyltransferase